MSDKTMIYLFEGEPAAPAAPAPSGDAPAATLISGEATPPTGGTPTATLPDGHVFRGLPPELASNPNLSKFANHENPLQALAEGHINAAALIGKNPSNLVDTETLSDASNLLSHMRTLGAPEEASGYTFEAPEGTPDSLASGPVIDAMAGAAAKAGVLPGQFQEVLQAAVGVLSETDTTQGKEMQARSEANVLSLKQQHGDMFDNQVNLAKLGGEKALGADFVKLLNDAGLGTNPTVINALAKLGERHTEDSAAGFGTDTLVATTANIEKADTLQMAAVAEKDPMKARQMVQQAHALRAAAHGEKM